MFVDFDKLKNNPYNDVTEENINNGFRVRIKGIYRSELKLYKIELSCGILKKKLASGRVDVCINEEYILNGIRHIVFEYLEVPSMIENRGVGSMLMHLVLEIIKEYALYIGEAIGNMSVSGWLSSADYRNKNWEKSLPFYQKVGDKNSATVIFRGRESGKEYTNAQEYLKFEANKDGDVIYRIR